MTPQATTMRGIQLIGHGDMDMLKFSTDLPVPTPGPGEVLIRVSAAGVNNTDINTRIGWYSKHDNAADDAGWTGEALKLPRIQGADVCGHIAAVGDGADTARIGQRVLVEPCLREAGGEVRDQPWYLGSECDGGFAEFTVVASRHAHAIDSLLSDVELASFPCSYSTAENMLTRSQVAPGERVLITGASGGVGSAAIQLAKARGAHVIAVSTESKAPALRELGADQVIPRDAVLTEVVGTNSIDVVIDLVAGPHWPQYLEVLRPGGRYAVSGAIAGPIVELDVRTLYLKDLSLFGCTVLGPDVFAALIQRIEQGQITPVVAHRFPLEQIAEAQRVFLEKKHVGKIVLSIREDAQ
ncbi:MAG: zinc-binding dehydrogenase [Denitromonas halophila]|nr:MAG: zinc-binding dehydrogenase [Denitromonas halophila]TVT67618.1 MAG: zinc-binding dehydrogenase [Denitromonas halophila]